MRSTIYIETWVLMARCLKAEYKVEPAGTEGRGNVA
jgi:hypothetical protein